MKRRSIKETALAFLSLTLISCAEKESDKVYDAQKCLDTSTSANVLTCLEKVADIQTAGASLIRCSAHMIYQEFTDPARLIAISDSMKTTSGSSTAAAIGLLAFSKTNGSQSAADLAELTLNECSAAGAKGMILLASMAQIATTIASSGITQVATDCDTSSPGYSASTCQAAVENAVCNADAETLGAAASLAFAESCQGSAQSSSPICQQFQSVTTGNSSNAQVGDALKDELKGTGNCP